MVPEFSGEGQQTLEDASILIIGASSIGSTLMYNLKTCALFGLNPHISVILFIRLKLADAIPSIS